MRDRSDLRARLVGAAVVLAILCVTASIYWPVAQAGFVWDDNLCYHDSAALRHGAGWTQLLLQGFCEWTNYFRPLVVALLTFEVRAFDVQPGPMHLVSLALHLANTLWVGLLAIRLIRPEDGRMPPLWTAAAAMLLYATHPALVEPVVWVGCQFDLVVTFFTLLGLIANTLSREAARACAVAACFFLAACAKESALALPPLLLVIDIATATDRPGMDWKARLLDVWRRQRRVYAGVLLAGAAYLALRVWALGALVRSDGETYFLSFAHFQEVCKVYLSYLRIIVWPMGGLNPLHVQNEADFADLSLASLAIDASAIAVFASGLLLAWRRNALGIHILAATAALFPVLHIIPLKFDGSLYHERYAMTAIAVTCALLPFSLANSRLTRRQLWLRVAGIGLASWLVLAVINIRVTLPLWSNDVLLWQWALRKNADSNVAKDHLLTAYLRSNDLVHARGLLDSMDGHGEPCPTCILNAANLAIAERDSERASAELEKLKDETRFLYDQQFLRLYIFATGGVLELQGDFDGAEGAYRESIKIDPLDPTAQNALAMLLLRRGKVEEARSVMQRALALMAPDERERRRQQFDASASRAVPPQ